MKAFNSNGNLRPDPLWTFLLLYVLMLMALIMWSCNPVKQVLRDKSKLDQVAAVVVSSGYCANDTFVVYQASDTIIKTDTMIRIEREIKTVNDTVYFWENKFFNIIKTKTIRDTVQKVVVDQAQANQLKRDLAVKDSRIVELKKTKNTYLKYIAVLVLILAAAIYSKVKR